MGRRDLHLRSWHDSCCLSGDMDNPETEPISPKRLSIWMDFFANHAGEDILEVRDWAMTLFNCSENEFNEALGIYRFRQAKDREP